MIGGWQLFIMRQRKAIYGNVRSGSLEKNKFTIAMTADIISEDKKYIVIYY